MMTTLDVDQPQQEQQTSSASAPSLPDAAAVPPHTTSTSHFATATQAIQSAYHDVIHVTEDSRQLNYINYGNACAYLLNFLVTFGIGVWGWFGLPSNSELSARYQTLITPAPWTFSIWSIIFLSQLIFAIVQLLPAFRSNPQVQDGIMWYYMAACGFQIVWTIFFSNEIFWLSFLAMIGILASLFQLLDSQSSVVSDKSWREYWFFRFPFQLHYGWIVVATLVNFSVWLVSSDAGVSFQVFIAVVSLIIIIAVSLFVLFVPQKPKFVVPLVMVWATGGIWEELSDPTGYMKAFFWGKTLGRMEVAVAVTCILILVATAVRMGLYYKRKEGEPTIDLVEAERARQESEIETPYVSVEDGTYA